MLKQTPYGAFYADWRQLLPPLHRTRQRYGMTQFLVIAMKIASFFKRPPRAAATDPVRESLKLKRYRKRRFYDNGTRPAWSGASFRVTPLFIAAFYHLFMPADYPASQSLIFLVTS